jgi:hypothetical protein
MKGASASRLREAKAKRGSGNFVPLPFDVLRSPRFAALSAHAIKLLLDLLAQYNLRNNGDFTAAWSVMKQRGWKSRDTLDRARAELERTEFVIRSRQGGRRLCNLYAVTFFGIDYCQGKLDVRPTGSPPGNWHERGRHLPPLPPRARISTAGVLAAARHDTAGVSKHPPRQQIDTADVS